MHTVQPLAKGGVQVARQYGRHIVMRQQLQAARAGQAGQADVLGVHTGATACTDTAA